MTFPTNKRYHHCLDAKILLILIVLLTLPQFSLAQTSDSQFKVDIGLGKGFLNSSETASDVQPEIDFSFIPMRFGIGLNAGYQSYTPGFGADSYRDGFESFTSVDGTDQNWNSFFIGLGPRFEFGKRLPVTFETGVDLSFLYTNPPDQTVSFSDTDGAFQNIDLQLFDLTTGEDFKKWTTALRPHLKARYSIPGVRKIALQLSTGVRHQLSDQSVSIRQRDLTNVKLVDNAREMFFQFEMAPLVERVEQTPKTSFFVNAGISFSFGGSKAPSVSSPFAENTSQPKTNDPGEEEEDQEEPEQLFVGFNGEFEVENLDITGNGATFSGSGDVFIDWISSYIAVEFSDITVDPNTDRLTSGHVSSKIDSSAPLYSKAWANQLTINSIAYTHPEIGTLHNWIVQQPFLEYNETNPTTTPIEAPFGLEIAYDTFISITELVFLPNQSKLNSVVAYETPADWNNADLVGFAIKDLEFHPQSIDFQQGRLEIVDDLTVGNANNDINFTFLKPDSPNPGTFIEWDDTGFTLFGVEIQSEFTRDWLLPVPDNGTDKVATTLSATGYSWNNLLLGGDLDKAEIVGSGGLTIEANALTYDMSDSLNPAGIEFPDIYTGVDTTNLWRGFHAENFDIGLPASVETHQSGPPEIGVNDLIIDHQGITLQAYANNVYQYPNASVADLNASVDSVEVNILTNSLVDAWIKGQVAIPATHPDSLQNPLNYHGLFATGVNTPNGSSFDLTIDPDGPIYTNLLKGTLTLEPSSVITASVTDSSKSFDMDLNGTIDWGSVNFGPVSDVTMGLDFAGMGFDYDSNSGLNFQMGAWSLASPQKYAHRFPITLQNIQFTPQPAAQGELLRGKIGFDTIFNLNDNIGGQTSMGIKFAIEDDSPSFRKFVPQYVGMDLDSVMVNANLSAVNINGLLYIDNDDPVYGKRVGGEVSAEFKGAGLNILAEAQFGNTSYQNGSQLYRYWQVDTQADFPAPGIPFLPGIAFRGFGGGAYHNMEVAVAQTGERSFTPQNNMFGFNAGATIATTPEEKGFNADVDLMGEFSTNGGGMTYVGFNGDFGTGASIMDRRNGKGKVFGNLLVDYVFPTKQFTFAANANINTDPVKTIPGEPFNLAFNLDGMSNDWSLKAGIPTSTNTVEVLGVDLYEYLMFGNSIPFPTGFTNTFTSAYVSHFGYNPNTAHMEGQIDSDLTEVGSGFALGVGVAVDHSGSKEVYNGAWRDWTVDWQLAAGAEMHLSFLEYGSCGSLTDFGINHWRAGGGLGFYASVNASANGYHRNKGYVDKSINIATLKAGGYMFGKFPKPVYLTGAIDGEVTVLNVFDISFQQAFEYGTNCSGSPVNTTVDLVQGDAAEDFAGNLIRYVVPLTANYFPKESPLSVQYGLVPDEEFSVPEQQSSGAIEVKSFKLEKTVTFEKYDNGSWVSQNVDYEINTLGEFQYYKPPSAMLAGPVQINSGLLAGSGGQTSGSGSIGQMPAQVAWSPNAQLNGGNTGSLSQFQNITLNPALTVGGGSTGPNYGSLPPVQDPPENNLEDNSLYRFTVDAVLKEKINGVWITATNNSGDPITQTVTKMFSTGLLTLPAQQNLTTY